jgi:anti-sigma28 factor (negative regulator of flagellin synthesis)
MKVHDSSLNSVTIGSHQTGRTESTHGGRAGKSSAPGGSGPDRISLSDLGSVVRSASGDNPGRTEKVSQLAAAYKSGSYHVNSHAVSKGIVDDALQTG